MERLRCSSMVAVAIGGVAWVFLYPILSGERKTEQRMASVSRSEPIARSARPAQKSRREQVEETLKDIERAQQEGQARTARHPHLAGGAVLVEASLPSDRRRARRRRLLSRPAERRRAAGGARTGICGRMRPAALAAVVSQEAAREPFPQSFPRRRRRHRARHQGRSAAARLPQGDRQRGDRSR